MKYCKRCDDTKSLNEFDKTSNRSVDGLFSWCRECRKSYDKERYRKIGLNAWKSGRINIRKERRIWFDQYKSTLKCNKCPENHPATLDFHHINPKDKDDSVSNMVADGRSEKLILAEVAKCDVLCSNCHRKLHYRS